jgi:hypothetical protein
MTITQQRRDTGAPSAWHRMRLWALAHAIDDHYQGLVPSVVPYFVLDRHYGYVAASGLTLTAPLLGLIASAHGPRGALLALLVIPPIALLCGTLLRDP